MSAFNIPGSEDTAIDNIQHKQKVSFTLLALLLSIIHFVFLLAYFEPAISTPDAQGYFAKAKLIAKEGKYTLSPNQYYRISAPIGFIQVKTGILLHFHLVFLQYWQLFMRFLDQKRHY